MSKHNKGIAFAATSALLYGFIPILGKTLVVYYHPLFVAFMVVFLSGIFIGVVAIWRRAIISNLNRKSIALAMVIGFFAALGSIFAFFGLTIGKANEAGFLFQLESFFAAVIAFYYLNCLL